MIEVSGIKKRYGRKEILTDISFKVQCGQRVAIIGRNGCGKTTLMQILAGILRPDGGEILYFDQQPLKANKLFKIYSGYVPQENPLIEELSVRDNIWLWGGKKNVEEERLATVFQLEDIWRMPVEKLSGGMKRRLSIACALVHKPPILLLDEPTTALDLYYKEGIHDYFKSYQDENGIIIMTTHDEKEILACDQCLLMQNGRLITLKQEEKNIETIRNYLSNV